MRHKVHKIEQVKIVCRTFCVSKRKYMLISNAFPPKHMNFYNPNAYKGNIISILKTAPSKYKEFGIFGEILDILRRASSAYSPSSPRPPLISDGYYIKFVHYKAIKRTHRVETLLALVTWPSIN